MPVTGKKYRIKNVKTKGSVKAVNQKVLCTNPKSNRCIKSTTENGTSEECVFTDKTKSCRKNK